MSLTNLLYLDLSTNFLSGMRLLVCGVPRIITWVDIDGVALHAVGTLPDFLSNVSYNADLSGNKFYCDYPSLPSNVLVSACVMDRRDILFTNSLIILCTVGGIILLFIVLVAVFFAINRHRRYQMDFYDIPDSGKPSISIKGTSLSLSLSLFARACVW